MRLFFRQDDFLSSAGGLVVFHVMELRSSVGTGC